jgi:DNA-binding helix-hairpin-helix protein with protein kinase domain
MLQGSLADLRSGTVAVVQTTAQDQGLTLGDTVKMQFQGGTLPLKVVAIYGGANPVGASYLVTPDTLVKGGLAPLDSLVYVTKDPSAATDTVRKEIEGVVKDLPTVTVKDPEGYAAEQKTQINQFLHLLPCLHEPRMDVWLRILASRCHVTTRRVKVWKRPMNQIQIQVVESEIRKRLLARMDHVMLAMLVIPQL